MMVGVAAVGDIILRVCPSVSSLLVLVFAGLLQPVALVRVSTPSRAVDRKRDIVSAALRHGRVLATGRDPQRGGSVTSPKH